MSKSACSQRVVSRFELSTTVFAFAKQKKLVYARKHPLGFDYGRVGETANMTRCISTASPAPGSQPRSNAAGYPMRSYDGEQFVSASTGCKCKARLGGEAGCRRLPATFSPRFGQSLGVSPQQTSRPIGRKKALGLRIVATHLLRTIH